MMQKAGSLFEYESLWSIILKAKEEKSHDFINQCSKSIWNISPLIYDKNWQENKNERELPQIDKRANTDNLG